MLCGLTLQAIELVELCKHPSPGLVQKTADKLGNLIRRGNRVRNALIDNVNFRLRTSRR
jgi:hypothetical protein